jgi:uncharacterized protein YbjT (DUF2867 family)
VLAHALRDIGQRDLPRSGSPPEDAIVSVNGTRGDFVVAGATGFVGRRLTRRLLRDGARVRCLVRDRDRARALLGDGAELIEVDLERPAAELAEAMRGALHGFFLVHLMSGGAGYAERERAIAGNFGAAASLAGVPRLSYLGGLGGRSPHLASRQATAEELARGGPPLTYFRAAMIVGPGSESYELLNSIIDRLPVAPSPSWLDNRTQPIGIRDVVAYLAGSPWVPAASGREVQIGGPDVLSHREVIEALALERGVSRPRWLPVADRVASPGVMAAGAATVTRGDRAVAAELALGLAEDTVVTDPTGAELFAVRPEPLSVVFQRCLDEEQRNRG